MEKKKIGLATYIVFLIILAVVIGIIVFFIIQGRNNKNNISNNNTNNQSSSSTSKENTSQQKKEEGEYFILYDGMEMKLKTGIQNLSDMEINQENKQKYNIRYFNYESQKYIGETGGVFGEPTYEGVSKVTNVRKIAISKKINAIPRETKTVEEFPEPLLEIADYKLSDLMSIDLDDDGKQEYIASYVANYDKDETEDGEPKAASFVMLLDSNYQKICNLVKLENGFWGNIKEEEHEIFVGLNSVEIIDIDNDGIMEIIVNIPTYEGTKINVLKYNKGNIKGEIDIEASVLP